jgi:hypothetical protein
MGPVGRGSCLLGRGVIDQLDLTPLEEAVQLLDIGLVEVELGDGRRYLTISQRAELPSAGDQRPDLFEFCKPWARYLTNDDLLLPLGRKRGDPPDERLWLGARARQRRRTRHSRRRRPAHSCDPERWM